MTSPRGEAPEARSAASPWREARNKLEVYRLVLATGPRLAAAPSLAEGVRQAYALGPYPALWAVEGLGLAWADAVWDRGEEPLLHTTEDGDALPPESLLMLHAGAGMAWARRFLRRLAAGGSRADAGPVVDELVAFCRRHCRPGYEGAALEALGMVTRLYYPRRVEELSRRLGERAAELAAFFWHGVGRGHYFLRRSFLPTRGAFRRAVARVCREAPGEAARAGAGAGLAWAVTLVNMRQPEVVAERLETLTEAAGESCVANGVASAVLMREETTPASPLLASFLRWQPDGPSAVAWQRRVQAPGDDALRWYLPALRQRRRLDEVFRCQDLTALADRRGG